MRKVTSGLFISLDGVIESPETWHFDYFNDEMGAVVGAMMSAADATLLGRQTYDEFAAYWPTADPADPITAQMNGARKYVVLNERLLLALEHVLAEVRAAGYRATTFTVMSGYRTPAYNRSLGNSRFSMHQWGAAADIFIDEDGNGVMDDLTGDGRSDSRDSELLYRLIDGAAARPETQLRIGGLGKYAPTSNHGPFVHVDVRDRTVRW